MTVSFFTSVGSWVDAFAAAVTDGTAAQAATLDARAACARANADAAAAAAEAAAAASHAADALASARAARAGRGAAAAGAVLDGALDKVGMVGEAVRVVVAVGVWHFHRLWHALCSAAQGLPTPASASTATPATMPHAADADDEGGWANDEHYGGAAAVLTRHTARAIGNGAGSRRRSKAAVAAAVAAAAAAPAPRAEDRLPANYGLQRDELGRAWFIYRLLRRSARLAAKRAAAGQ